MTKYEKPCSPRPNVHRLRLHADRQDNVRLVALGAACCTEGHDATKGVSDGH